MLMQFYLSPQDAKDNDIFEGIPRVKHVHAVPSTGYAIDVNGDAWSWGSNADGLLGADLDPSVVLTVSSPVKIAGNHNFTKFYNVGAVAVIALRDDLSLWAWGRGQYGALGTGSTSNQSSPKSVIGTGIGSGALTPAGPVYTTGAVALVQGTDGYLWGWGRGVYGEFGDGNTGTGNLLTQPTRLFANNYKLIRTYPQGVYAIDQNNDLWAWGDRPTVDFSGTLSNTSVATPTKVQIFPDKRKIVDILPKNPTNYPGRDALLFKDEYGILHIIRHPQNRYYKSGDLILDLPQPYYDGSDEVNLIGRRQAPGFPYIQRHADSIHYGGASVEQTGVHSQDIYGAWWWRKHNYGSLDQHWSFENKTFFPSPSGYSYYYGLHPWVRNTPYHAQQLLGVGPSSATLALTAQGRVFLARKDYGGTSGVKLIGSGEEEVSGYSFAQLYNRHYARRYWPSHDFKFDRIDLGDDFIITSNLLGEELIAWGGNDNYQLGDRTSTHSSTPKVLFNWHFNDFIVYRDNTLAWHRPNDSAFFPYVWGSNTDYRLGVSDATTDPISFPVQWMPHGRYSKVVAGSSFAIALTKGGKVNAWGAGDLGGLSDIPLLGNGELESQGMACEVLLPQNKSYTDVASGYENGYALDTDGNVWCWGRGNYYAIGNASNQTIHGPVTPVGGHVFSRIYAGFHFALGYNDITDEAYAWGFNNSGQLGVNDRTSRSSPTQVIKTRSFDKICIAPQGQHVIAMDKDDNTMLWTWGDNTYGQLGIDSIANQSTPIQVSLPSGTQVEDIAAGATFSLALDNTGKIWGWGRSLYIGIGETQPMPTEISPIHVATNVQNPTAIFATDTAAYALDNNGEVWAIGPPYENSSGGPHGMFPGMARDNLPSKTYHAMPKNISDISGAEGFTFFRCADGNLYGKGEVIDPDETYDTRIIPVLGNDFEDYEDTAPGPILAGIRNDFLRKFKNSKTHSGYVDLNNDYLVLWGSNSYGQLGDGTTTNRSDNPVAIDIREGHDFQQLAIWSFTCAGLDANGQVWAWGNSGVYGGALGSNIPNYYVIPDPTPIVGDHSFTQLTAGYQFHVALDENGKAWAWGSNSNGNLGDDSLTTRTSPVPVARNIAYDQIASGAYFTVAIDSANGHLYAWGRNNYGQLGLDPLGGPVIRCSTPIRVSLAGSFIKVVCGNEHCLALRWDGKLFAWGRNGYGELGDDSTTVRSKPVAVDAANNYKDICAGYAHSYAIRSDNDRVYAWGRGYSYRLGINSAVNKSTPVEMSFPVGFVAGRLYNHTQNYTFVVSDSGSLWGAGENSNGQLGMGHHLDARTPEVAECVHFSPIDVAANIGTFFLRDDGVRYISGRDRYTNSNGEFGDGTVSHKWYTAPYPAHNRIAIQAVEIADDFTLMIKNGFLWGCGRNTWGQLGNGNNTDQHDFQKLNTTFSEVNSLSARTSFAVATTYDGGTYAWGAGTSGQLGNNAALDSNVPVSVAGNHSFKKVLASSDHVLALKDDGTIWAWGDNSLGQLGNGTTINESSPIHVATAYSFWDIYVGDQISMGIAEGGDIYIWGRNPGNGLYWEETAPPAYNANPVLLDASRFKFWSNNVWREGGRDNLR